jgi:acyl-CoA dehydrogenase
MWEFETDPEFQAKLEWADTFVREEVEPLDHLLGDPADKRNPDHVRITGPLMQRVKDQGLWACHLGSHLGGPGYGQVKLVLLYEILGRSRWATTIFGSMAPNTGNAEILAAFGTPSQKERYLEPLLDGRISSSFSMTEPHGGSDPRNFVTFARRDGDGWVLDGEKWISSDAAHADFLIVMSKTDMEVDAQRGMTMFLVPTDTPGVRFVRNSGLGASSLHEHSHSHIKYEGVKLGQDAVLGAVGGAFDIAQYRLGGGRVHQGGRALGQMRKAFEMMCERVVSRPMRGKTLADWQFPQGDVADTYVDIEQFKLLLLQTAWRIDKYDDYSKVRKEIAAVKVAMSRIYSNIIQKAMHLHGAIGISTEMPFAEMLIMAEVYGIGDGPIEVHRIGLAKQILKDVEPGDPVFPREWLPTRREQARALYGDVAALDYPVETP